MYMDRILRGVLFCWSIIFLRWPTGVFRILERPGMAAWTNPSPWNICTINAWRGRIDCFFSLFFRLKHTELGTQEVVGGSKFPGARVLVPIVKYHPSYWYRIFELSYAKCSILILIYDKIITLNKAIYILLFYHPGCQLQSGLLGFDYYLIFQETKDNRS